MIIRRGDNPLYNPRVRIVDLDRGEVLEQKLDEFSGAPAEFTLLRWPLQETRASGGDWQMIVYGGVQHSFTNPRSHLKAQPGIKFDEVAFNRSWQAMLDLLAETF